MKNKLVVLLIGLLIFGLAGCGGFLKTGSTITNGTDNQQSNDTLEVNISAKANFVDNNKVKFTIETNLPDGMELMIELSSPEDNYDAQDKVAILGGIAETAEFTNHGDDLDRGNYKLVITSPTANVQPISVQSIIGKKGNNLKGKFVKEDSTFGKTVYFEQVVGMHENYSSSAKGDNERLNDLLFESIRQRDYSSALNYIKEGANVNYINNVSKVTPLMMACLLGDEKMITFLLENGADINMKNDSGSTAIFYCGKRERIINLLQANGADMNVVNNNGKTYLDSVKIQD